MKKINFFVLSFLSLFFVLSCSKKGQYNYEYDNASYETSSLAYSDTANAKSLKLSSSFSQVQNSAIDDFALEESDIFSESSLLERKLIKNGNISIYVDSLEEANKKIESWVENLGGYISNSQMNKYSYSYTARIPSERFDEAMIILNGLGELNTRSVFIEDVTERYYDLEDRLESKKILKDKYSEYLKKAQNIKDLLEIERQLNSVISEIESMEGQMKRLVSQIDYSTISVTISASEPSYESERHIMGVNFKDFIYDTGDFFVSLFKVLLRIIVYGSPILLLISFFYWLLLGKIGLLKRFFVLLSGKVSKNQKNQGGNKKDSEDK